MSKSLQTRTSPSSKNNSKITRQMIFFRDKLVEFTKIIEKNTHKSEIAKLCLKHGADLMVFKGQPSVTRTNEICERAKNRNLELCILYLFDLDVAGWMMPNSFLKRVNEIYPAKHILKRVLLLREQVEKYNIPPSFDTKKKHYSKNQVSKFINETGSEESIELDALPIAVFLEILNDALSEYSGIEADLEDYELARDTYNSESYDLKDTLDLDEFEEQYNEIKQNSDKLMDEIETFKSYIIVRLDECVENRKSLESEIQNHIQYHVGEE